MIPRHEIAARIRETRKHCGLTQEKFAERIDYSVSAYKKLEAGGNNVSIECLYSMKRHLNISSDYILFGKRENSEDAWNKIVNSSDEDKMVFLLRLLMYFTRIKEEKYISPEEQAEYDLQLSGFLNNYLKNK